MLVVSVETDVSESAPVASAGRLFAVRLANERILVWALLEEQSAQRKRQVWKRLSSQGPFHPVPWMTVKATTVFETYSQVDILLLPPSTEL